MAKFALPMKDGVAVSTMAELREHFDLKEAIKYLGNGRLMKWLRDREDYDEEADKLDTLIDECKGNHLELAKRLCTILNVEFDESKFNAEELDGLNELSQKAEKLGQYTSDSAILTSADRCAFNQAELDKLVQDDKFEIYLCNGEFTIPLVKKEKRYFGFGNAIAKIPSNEYVDFEELGIQFDKEKYKVKFDEKYEDILKQNQESRNKQCSTLILSDMDDERRKEIMAEYIDKFEQIWNFFPHDVTLGDIFSLSQKSAHSLYWGNIEKDPYITYLVEHEAVIYSDIIYYLCDMRVSGGGCIIFTDNAIVDYKDNKHWVRFPYSNIKDVFCGDRFLSIRVDVESKFLKDGKYEFEQDFGGRGWNARNIGLFLQTVSGVRPINSKKQDRIKKITLETLGGHSLFE